MHFNFIIFHITGKNTDYYYASPKIYNYTFHVGSISAYPDANITITDDLVGEDEEFFQIVIIDDALQFNVEAGRPATIFMNNDSKYI